MSAVASAPAVPREGRADRVSWMRLLWVAPLTVVASAAVCFALRAIIQVIDPSLARMPQLGPAMMTLAVEGAIAAVVVFVLFVLFVPRAIFWFRIVAVAALVLSWIPDIALGLGGTPMRTAMRYVAPLTSIGFIGEEGGRPAGPPPGAQTGGPPPAFFSALPIQQVLVLMLLHTAVAAVSIIMLTALTRDKSAKRAAS